MKYMCLIIRMIEFYLPGGTPEEPVPCEEFDPKPVDCPIEPELCPIGLLFGEGLFLLGIPCPEPDLGKTLL